MKVVAALAAMVFCVSAIPLPSTFPHEESAIVKITCHRANGTARGTAFKVGANSYITAAHVVMGGVCSVEGEAVQITALDVGLDYASFHGPSSDVKLETDCGGFKGGNLYLARGFPGGGSYKIAAPWFVTGIRDNEMQVSFGDSIPGMSGGPVMDDNGAVAGIVVRHSPARALPLSETSYCRGSDALKASQN